MSNITRRDKFVDFSAFAEMLDNVSQKFYDRFAEFDSIKEQTELFSNPMEIQIEAQPSEFQLELSNQIPFSNLRRMREMKLFGSL